MKLLAFAGMWMMLAPFAVDALAQGSWTMKAPIPLARNEVALAAVGGKVHVIGGRFGALPDKTDIYDSATNSWTSGPPLPTARSGLAYTLYRNLVLVLGGELPPNTFAENGGLRSEDKQLEDACTNARGQARHGCGQHRWKRLSRRGIVKARLRRRYRPAHHIYDAIGDLRMMRTRTAQTVEI